MKGFKRFISIILAVFLNYFIMKIFCEDITKINDVSLGNPFWLLWFIVYHVTVIPFFVEYYLSKLIMRIIDADYRYVHTDRSYPQNNSAFEEYANMTRQFEQDRNIWELQRKGKVTEASELRGRFIEENRLRDIERNTRR